MPCGGRVSGRGRLFEGVPNMAMPARWTLARFAGGCILPFFILCLLAASPAGTETDRDEAPQQTDTFQSLMTRAQAGDAKAQCDVGVAYLNGTKVAQDFRKALFWLSKASDGGFGYARFVLADAYSRGYAGVPVDDEKTYYYASLAAAASALPEKYRDRAIKLRDMSAKRLTTAQVSGLQAKAALAPLDATAK